MVPARQICRRALSVMLQNSGVGRYHLRMPEAGCLGTEIRIREG